jgi:chromosome segregation ATPase
VEDRISELEDKIGIKGKTEEMLVKQLKSCERNMQELTDSIKRPNLRIIGTEEEEVQEKGICNIFNKNNDRKFPKSRESFAHSGTGSLKDTKQT